MASPQLTDKMINSVLVLSDEHDWRIRRATLDAIPQICKTLSYQQFADKLLNLVFNYLNDSVNYVRRTCAVCLEIGRASCRERV